VAAGTGATDAVNKGQLDAVTAQALETAKKYAQTGDKQTLRRANAYTDQQIRAALGGDMAAFRQNVNDRFYQVDRRMDRLSAMQSASTQMAINAAGAQGNGRLAARDAERAGQHGGGVRPSARQRGGAVGPGRGAGRGGAQIQAQRSASERQPSRGAEVLERTTRLFAAKRRSARHLRQSL
jgi:hypothetical protein